MFMSNALILGRVEEISIDKGELLVRSEKTTPTSHASCGALYSFDPHHRLSWIHIPKAE
jgi:hypothetical protein